MFDKLSNINHLWILSSIINVFIYKKEQDLKFEKYKAWALKDTLLRYDGHTIYKGFIQKQNKVIWIKNLQIFEHIRKKTSIFLSNFEKNPIIKGFFAIIGKSIFFLKAIILSQINFQDL